MLLHTCGYNMEFMSLFIEAGFDCIQPLEVKAGNDMLKLKKDYLGKFKKVLPAQKVMRFYQIENKIDAIVEYELVDKIPLAHKAQ